MVYLKEGRKQFLSTLPVRGATYDRRGLIPRDEGFLSTLPVRGATDWMAPYFETVEISIHAPREGSDG